MRPFERESCSVRPRYTEVHRDVTIVCLPLFLVRESPMSDPPELRCYMLVLRELFPSELRLGDVTQRVALDDLNRKLWPGIDASPRITKRSVERLSRPCTRSLEPLDAFVSGGDGLMTFDSDGDQSPLEIPLLRGHRAGW